MGKLDLSQVAIRPAFSGDIFTLQVLYSLPFDIYEIHLSLIVYYTHCNCDYQLQIFTPDCYFTSLFHILLNITIFIYLLFLDVDLHPFSLIPT